MKKITLFLICIAFLLPMKSFSLCVQDSTKTKHEFSVSYNKSYNNSANFNYSRKISTKLWLRFGIDYYGNYFSNKPKIGTSFPTGNYSDASTFLVGLERHKLIKTKLKFISGFNLRLCPKLTYSRVDNPGLPEALQRETNISFVYGIGATFGLYYNISENFSVGSSLNPGILYERKNNDFNTINSLCISLTDVSFICFRYQL